MAAGLKLGLKLSKIRTEQSCLIDKIKFRYRTKIYKKIKFLHMTDIIRQIFIQSFVYNLPGHILLSTNRTLLGSIMHYILQHSL